MLDERLRDTQGENGVLMQRIMAQRAEMESILQGLEGVVADLEGSVEAIGEEVGGGLDRLRPEIWEMEGDMQGTAGR